MHGASLQHPVCHYRSHFYQRKLLLTGCHIGGFMKEGTTSELWMRQCCADIRILFGFVKPLMCHMEHLVDIVSIDKLCIFI